MDKLDKATNKAEVLVEKHRHGATRAIELTFEGSYTRFSNYAGDRDSPAAYQSGAKPLKQQATPAAFVKSREEPVEEKD
jgi:hypothetical protein